MSEPVTVIGGADGITANLNDVQAFARLVQHGADAVADAFDDLTTASLRWMLDVGAGRDAAGARAIQDDLAVIAGALRTVHDQLGHLSLVLSAAMMSYRDTDNGILDSITGALLDFTVGGLRLLDADRHGASQVLASLPGMTDLTMMFAGGLGTGYSLAVPDGHPVLHDMGIDARAAAQVPPHRLADLIGGLALRNTGLAGEVSVGFVVGTDGRRRAIVDIPGTKSWNPVPSSDVTSVGTDIRALGGGTTAYEQGILLALDAAGVGPDDEVMLVGHSEGGIVAVDAARHAARTGRFRITHIVTAGSPIGKLSRDLPDSVQVLALENSADLVPHVDAATNPDRPNVTTVTVDDQHNDVGANHDLTGSYLPAANAADFSCNQSVNAFVQSARGFLESATMQTHGFRITRGL